MKKKIILWLSTFGACMVILYSCAHDDLTSPSDPQHQTLVSKSLWKEDETFIRNVMKIYLEHETKIKKVPGTPSWEYAMSMGKMDETFMVVPIVDNGKVVNTLVCARFDKKVYFRYESSEDNNHFFNEILSGKEFRVSDSSNSGKTSAQKGTICVSQSVSVWHPNDENSPWPGQGAGHWETSYYNNCYSYQDYSNPDFGGSGEDNGGFDYGGGSGGSGTDTNDFPNPVPCEKLTAQSAKPVFKSKIQDLEGKLGLKGETGYVEKVNGTFDIKTNSSSSENANSLSLGDPTSDMIGFLHTHINDYTDDDGTTHTGFKIFSPADVIYFNQLVALAQQNGIPLDTIYAVMVSGTGTYELRFTGNVNQIKTVYTNTKAEGCVFKCMINFLKIKKSSKLF
jgi:hypothetical protein